MVVVARHTKAFIFRKWLSVYIYPTLAFLYIGGDWYQTKQLKEGKRPHALDEILRIGDGDA